MSANDTSSLVTQSNNQAGGDIVGGNKINNHFGAPSPSGHLTLLLERYALEVSNDEVALDKLKELERYGKAKEDPLIPLEIKLRDGQREDLLEQALEWKEEFAKELVKHTLFPSAQKIHVHLLSKICSTFATRILPEIRSGQSRMGVEKLIQSEIIEPILCDLQENPFCYSYTEVQGMIYYLTGNCHIRWS